VDRYDKMFCAGDRSEETGDLAHYSPGSHFSVFSIKGVRCGALICHDYRYPELYREYKRRGVRLVFHSYHAGNIPPERFEAMRDGVGERFQRLNPGATIPGITMLATMVAEAANNHVWMGYPESQHPCAPSRPCGWGRRGRDPWSA
jgi:deaminated glutathione amidase